MRKFLIAIVSTAAGAGIVLVAQGKSTFIVSFRFLRAMDR